MIEVEASTTFDKEGEEDDKKAAGKDATNEENECNEGEQATNYQGPTNVQNTSKKDVWLKPEINTEAPVLLKVGQKTSMNIDGATHPDFPGQVFKVTNLGNTFGVHVNNKGVFFDGMGMGALNSASGGGWKGGDWLDQRHDDKDFGWDPIFTGEIINYFYID